MSLKTIKNENGIYVELPKDKIEFVSKEAEIIYDLSLENDFLQQENQELNKQLKEWKFHLKNANEMLNLQGQDGNYNYDSYMLGLYNGMEYIIALFETREPIYKDGKNIEFLNDKNQQKEFIEWLEEKIKVTEDKLDKYDELVMQGEETDIEYYESMINKGIFDAYKVCLSKYKNIVGVEDELQKG